jgi:hypothetical protein
MIHNSPGMKVGDVLRKLCRVLENIVCNGSSDLLIRIQLGGFKLHYGCGWKYIICWVCFEVEGWNKVKGKRLRRIYSQRKRAQTSKKRVEIFMSESYIQSE